MTTERAAFAALLAALGVLAAIVATMPAFPVDETRYLTVAWEMRANNSWALPTLNFAPYSHKPPLLFWLVNGFWSMFGLHVWPARLVGFLSMAAVLFFTHRLDRAFTHDDGASGPALSVLILLGLPIFVGLGFAIMFDMLLTASVMGGLLALWQANRTGGCRPWLLFGLSLGVGLLAKGPVVLLYLLPPALLAQFWVDPARMKGWYLRVLGAVAIGAAMVLAWAIPAAILGGPDYAAMLFWKQSAGRMASSFAHARPFWFYVPIAALFFLPLVLWRPMRESLRSTLGAASDARNFLLSAILPAFVGLSLISGKQLHYFLPIVPSLALLISFGLRDVAFRPSDHKAFVIFACAVAALIPATVVLVRRWVPLEGTLLSVISDLHLVWVVLAAAIAISILLALNRSLPQFLTAVALTNMIVLICLAAQSRDTVTELYDLRPMSRIIANLGDRPLATTQRSRGEFGFLSQLRKPMAHVQREDLACWMFQNPNGVAIVRSHGDDKDINSDGAVFRTLYEQDYRNDELFQIVEKDVIPPDPCRNHPSQDWITTKENEPD